MKTRLFLAKLFPLLGVIMTLVGGFTSLSVIGIIGLAVFFASFPIAHYLLKSY